MNRFYRERAVGISFHIWVFASGREDFSVTHFPRMGVDILSEVQASTMKRASRTSHGEGPGSVQDLQKKNFQKHEQRLKKKCDMQVTANLLFHERAMMMIFSFLYIVFCKRAKRLLFFEQILPRAGGGNFFSYMGFRERARRFSVDTFFRERALIFCQKCKRA